MIDIYDSSPKIFSYSLVSILGGHGQPLVGLCLGSKCVSIMSHPGAQCAHLWPIVLHFMTSFEQLLGSVEPHYGSDGSGLCTRAAPLGV